MIGTCAASDFCSGASPRGLLAQWKWCDVMRKSDFDGLETMDRMGRHGWYACTWRHFPLRVAKRLEAAGLAESAMCQPVDGDGFAREGHRERLSFRLTPAGKAALAEARERLGSNGYPCDGGEVE